MSIIQTILKKNIMTNHGFEGVGLEMQIPCGHKK